MHPIITFYRTLHSNVAGRPVADPCDRFAQASSLREISSPFPQRVLSVGRMDEDAFMREPLDHSPVFSFSHANDYRELWALSRGNTYDAVIFHNSLGRLELEEATRLVRRRWPAAKILLIRSGEITLDDPAYDQRLRPPVDPNTLMSILWGQMRLKLAKPRRRRVGGPIPWKYD